MSENWAKTTVMIGVTAAFMLIVFALMWFGVSNQEVRLRNQIGTQQKNCEIVFDNTWKIISQKAQVADKYKDAFAKIYPELMAGRYDKGGGLMKFVTESNSQFDVSLYKDLMSSIEGQRNIFTREQAKLIDYKREHDNLRQEFPSSIVVGGRPEIVVKIVTSDRTSQAFDTGKDNDVKL